MARIILLTADVLDIKVEGIVLPLNDPIRFCFDDPS
jgi:hypothetical protein